MRCIPTLFFSKWRSACPNVIHIFIFTEIWWTHNVTLVLAVRHSDLTSPLCCVPCKCSSCLPWDHTITVPLTTFTMLYLSSLWFVHSVTTNLYLPLPFAHFAHSLTTLSSGNYYCVLCVYGSVYLFICLLDLTYKWNHTVFLFDLFHLA